MSPVDRAAAAEQAVLRRSLRRLWGVPATRLGVVGWPPSTSQRLFLRWHYWWQAHLLDCLVDAQLRAPAPQRAGVIRALARGHLIRNGLHTRNAYYDDMAWWALALQRAQDVVGPRYRRRIRSVTLALLDAWSDDVGGGIPWRRKDVFRNTPANGPAAILLARNGYLARAAETADWIERYLVVSDSDLIADGLVPRGGADDVELNSVIYTYNQGVVLGAELELVLVTGRPPEKIHRLVRAVDRHLAGDGVLTGHGGGNGGLFTGILTRYLAQVATRLPGAALADQQTRVTAAELVLASAESAWANRSGPDDLPTFGPDWAATAGRPRRGGTGLVRGNAEVTASREPERDLSVQLGGWMLMEAAALVQRNETLWRT